MPKCAGRRRRRRRRRGGGQRKACRFWSSLAAAAEEVWAPLHVFSYTTLVCSHVICIPVVSHPSQVLSGENERRPVLWPGSSHSGRATRVALLGSKTGLVSGRQTRLRRSRLVSQAQKWTGHWAPLTSRRRPLPCLAACLLLPPPPSIAPPSPRDHDAKSVSSESQGCKRVDQSGI